MLLKQVLPILERILQDPEEKRIRNFSQQGGELSYSSLF